MDICNYINSKDISKYLRCKKYEFNIQEAIWIASTCNFITYEEKLKLYDEIINTYSDCKYFDGKSLHDDMKLYIDYNKQLLDEFKNDNKGYIFNIDVRCQHDINNHINRVVFSSYEKACDYIRNTILNEKFMKNCGMGKIYKIWIEKKTLDEDSFDNVLLNNELEIMNLNAPRIKYKDDIEKYCYKMVGYYLYDKNFKLPVPFKTGDLLECRDWMDEDKKKYFIFDKICMLCEGEDGHCDSGYYSAFGYTLDRYGKIEYRNQCDNYLDIEYCHDIFSYEALELNPISHLVRKDDNVYC